jgi:isopropylmalate/homocitrate/citramalate synthase
MKSSIDTTIAAREAGLYTVFFTIDATRTELNRFLDIVSQVATEGHMDALTIADTLGVCTPEAVHYVVGKVIDRLKKPVEIHCHQDFGLGVANTVAALERGASVAHTTITGLGERAGNVPMEDVVLSLLCLHDVDLGIKTEKFVETSKFVMDLAKVQQPPNRPIVGDKLYEGRVGIIAGWVRLVPQGAPARVRAVHAGARRPEAGQHRPRQEQRTPVDLRSGPRRPASRSPTRSAWRYCCAVKAKSFEKKDLLTAEEFKEIVRGS